MSQMGKLFILVGAIFVGLGLFLTFMSQFSSFKIGRLPGDIYIKRGNFTFYFPLMTSIILSILLTFIFYFLGKFRQ